MSTYGFVPLSHALPYWPSDLFSQPEFLDEVGVREFQVQEGEELIIMSGILVWIRELSLDFSGLKGFSVAVLSGNGYTAVPFEVDVLPDFAIRLLSLSIAIRLTSDWLRPVRPENGTWVLVRDTNGNLTAAELRLEGVGVQVDLDGDLDLKMPADGPQLHMGAVQIGDTGFVLEIDGVIPYLSRKQPSPQGVPLGFRGIAIESAKLHLPGDWDMPLNPTSVEFEDLLIGTGGLSGAVRGNWNPTFDAVAKHYAGDGAGTLFGIPLGLHSLELTFYQNVPTASAIHCEMVFPFFDQPVGVDLGLGLNGDFTVAISAVQPEGVTRNAEGLIEFEKPGIFRLSMDSLSFEKDGDDFLVKLSGKIKLLYGNFDWPEVDVKELRIDKHGHIHINGGWIDLPKSASFHFLEGFTMELTRISFGNTDDGRKWVGFSGSIILVDELAFGAAVDGLKVLWDSSGHVDLQLSEIDVALAIPDVLFFYGSVAYFQDAGTKGFKGDIALTLDPLGLSLEARLIIGRTSGPPAYNYFYILIEEDLPAGIPFGQTNLAFYGFTGLLADNMAPNKNADQEWYAWYRGDPVGTTDTSKWKNNLGSLALGAGITIGTAADNGYAASSKGLLILLLPGPLLVLDAKANMLKERSKLSGNAEADYRALAILDKRAGTFLLNIQPHLKYDYLTGAMIDVLGVAEGFFNSNAPDAWHLYLGQEPPSKRIRARIFKGLLPADAFLMLDRQGMRMGASAGWDKSYHAGPLAIDLRAILEGKADVSWRPVQLDGTLTLDGTAGLHAYGFSSTASINALLAVQAPNPYHVHGEFRLKLKTPWPFPDPSARIKLDWGSPSGEPVIEPVLASVAGEHLKTTEAWELDQSSPSGPVLPLDAKLLLSFHRPIADRALIGGNSAPSPSREKVGPLQVAYELVGLELNRRERGSQAAWITEARKMEGQAGSGDLYGMWLPLPEGDKSAGKLQLWSRSPYNYTRNTGRSYLDWFTSHYPDYPCPPQKLPEELCTDFEMFKEGPLPRVFTAGDLIFEALQPETSARPQVAPQGWNNLKHALMLYSRITASIPIPIRINFPEPASQARLSVRTTVSSMTVNALKDGQVLASAEKTAGDHEIELQAPGIEYLELLPVGQGTLFLLRVCYTSQSDQLRAFEIAAIREHLKQETQRWCNEDYLLKADSDYQLKVTTRVRRWRDGEEMQPDEYIDNYNFQTSSPPGFMESTPDSRSLLGTLNRYVDKVASTLLNNNRPVYRGYDIRLVFNENYIERMYSEALHALSFELKDRNGVLAEDEHGVPVAISTHWDHDPYTRLSDRDEHWLRTLDQNDCASSVDRDCIPLNNSFEASLPEGPLAPQALIEARLRGSSQEVYRSTFVTSRFVTFTHHIHSFQGGAWDYERLTGGPNEPLLTSDELTNLEDLVRAKHDGTPNFEEGAAFETISQTLFKLRQRPLPERLEITSLLDSIRSYALLLESPEPIDWARANLRVRYMTGVAPTQLSVSSPVKIIEVAFGQRENTDPSAYNTEWVDMLIREDINLNGFTVEHSNSSGQNDNPFIPYYQFHDESVLPTGTIIRIHSGAQAEDSTPILERVHCYATAADGEHKWLLNNAGDTVRLLDASGREVYRWSFLPNNAYQDLDAILICNLDQTRVFIFFPNLPPTPVGEVPKGRLRLEWIFMRNVGANMPVLKRGGSDQPENTSLEFDLPAQLP